MAELTEAALKRHALVALIRWVIGIRDLFGLPLLAQEGTLLLAELAVDACL
jgi:hypothetical protein